MKKYEPELGQWVFGQDWQENECPDDVIAAIRAIDAILGTMEGLHPAANTGDRYDSPVFSMHAYSWSDEPQPWNFKWRDIRVSWYKYLGRGTTINKRLRQKRLRKMLRECTLYLLKETR